MSKHDSTKVAVALIKKMVELQKKLDAKSEKTASEKRHLAFLRSMRRF